MKDQETGTPAWGIEEDGELWNSAYATRREAIHDLAEALCELGNESKNPTDDKPWRATVIPVLIMRVPKDTSARDARIAELTAIGKGKATP